MGAVCYAELSTALPFSGGEYSYIKRALGSPLGFIFLWTATFNRPASNAARALLFSEYAIQPFYGECPAPEMAKKSLALAVLWFLGILNGRSVKMAAWVQTVFTFLKMMALSIIAIGGIVLLIRGKKKNTARFENAFSSEIPDAVQISEAFFQGLYAYGGWWSLSYLAGMSSIFYTKWLAVLSIKSWLQLAPDIPLFIQSPFEVMFDACSSGCSNIPAVMGLWSGHLKDHIYDGCRSHSPVIAICKLPCQPPQKVNWEAGGEVASCWGKSPPSF